MLKEDLVKTGFIVAETGLRHCNIIERRKLYSVLKKLTAFILLKLIPIDLYFLKDQAKIVIKKGSLNSQFHLQT